MAKNALDDIMAKAESIKKAFDDEKRKLPYNINVIDELHVKANENAHSRILCKLLQYRDSDRRYRILESFIQNVAQSVPSFASIVVQNPVITQEEERIDLWVRDNNYAIILENKVRGAADQGIQLERYIKKTLKQNYKYSENNVFVIYLPPTEAKDPDEQSWGKYAQNSDIRKLNYAKISFNDYVLPWLKEEVLPNCTLKEELLSSALKQYIDYLEGFFNLRISQKDTYRVESNKLYSIFNVNNEKDLFSCVSKTLNEISEINIKTLKKDEQEIAMTAKGVLDVYRNERIEEFRKNFSELSRKILHDNFGGEWKDRAYFTRDKDSCYLVYSDKWESISSSWKIHLEWKNVSIENLFFENHIEYSIYFHDERSRDNKISFKTDLNNELNQQGWVANLYIYKTKQIASPLGWMTKDELKTVLENIYNDTRLKKFIEAVNKTIK